MGLFRNSTADDILFYKILAGVSLAVGAAIIFG